MNGLDMDLKYILYTEKETDNQSNSITVNQVPNEHFCFLYVFVNFVIYSLESH